MKKTICTRIMSLVIALTMLAAMAACGQSPASSAVPNATTDPSSTAPAAKKSTLKVLTWSNQGSVDAINNFAKDFMARYPEITVEVTDVDTNQYDMTLATRQQANDVDLFTMGDGFTRPSVDWAPSEAPAWQQMVENGVLLDITDQPWVKNWSSGVPPCTYQGRVYAIATAANATTGIFYNKKLFADNGWSAPKTWSEFEKLCSDIKAKGMVPLTVGGGDVWPYLMQSNGVMASLGVDYEAYWKGLWTGETRLNDETGLKAFERMSYINENLEPNFMGISYAEVIGRFVSGKAAMLMDGAWQATEFAKVDPNFAYGYFPLPGEKEGVALEGKFDLCFGINANSKNTDAALKWMEMLSEKEQYTKFIDTAGFIPTMDGVDVTNAFISEMLPYTQGMKNAFELYRRIPANAGQYAAGTGFNTHYLKNAGGDIATPKELADLAQKDLEDAIKATLGK